MKICNCTLAGTDACNHCNDLAPESDFDTDYIVRKNKNIVIYGWKCPSCGQVNSPYNLKCDCKKDSNGFIEQL